MKRRRPRPWPGRGRAPSRASASTWSPRWSTARRRPAAKRAVPRRRRRSRTSRPRRPRGPPSARIYSPPSGIEQASWAARPARGAGFRCGNPVAGKSYYDISVPLTFPCYYDVAGKDYTSMQDVIRSKPQLTKYFEGCLDLARTGGAYRTEADREAEARPGPRTVGATPKPTGAIVAASFTQPATTAKRKATPEPTPVAKVTR